MSKWIIAFAALFMLPVPAAAATGGEQAAPDAFQRVLDAIEGNTPKEAVIDSSVRAIELTWRQNPTMANLERQRPGIIAAFSQAARPTLANWYARVRAEFHPRFVAVLRERLTRDEAIEIAGFYESPLGRELTAGVLENHRGEAMAAARAQGQSVTAAEVRADAAAASRAALAGLSEETRNRSLAPSLQAAMLKLGTVRGEFSELRAQMEKVPLTAAENAMLQAALAVAFEARR